MNKMFCVSFPRSGSTWLKFALHHIMQDKFQYCDSHQTAPDYDRDNWIKSHDFNLDVEPPPGYIVIFQCRDPLDAVPSWWNLRVRDGLQLDDYFYWLDWAPSAFRFWKQLRQKWVPKADMIIWTQDLQLAPRNFLRRIGEKMTDDFQLPDGPLLPEFNQPTSGREFEHYRERDFNELLKLTK